MDREVQELPKGLTLEEGVSYEVAVAKLNEGKISYEVRWEKNGSQIPFFRSSEIIVNSHSHLAASHWVKLCVGAKADLRQSSRDLVREILGFPEVLRSGAYFYYAAYKIGQDFDFDNLSGIYRFNKGRLMERVIINFE